MKPLEIISGFDAFLFGRGLSFEAVVIGGTALGLLGIVSRQTRDCDILRPKLPEVIRTASMEFAERIRGKGGVLQNDWLNNGPSSLADNLPKGWESRLQVAFSGTAIKLFSLGRLDLLRSKLFALCDRGIDLQDCLALKPIKAELAEIAPWLEQQDANPDWPAHVRETIEDLQRRLAHGV